MKNDSITTEILKIPLDMAMDILTIIVREELRHEVIEVIPSRSQFVLEVSCDKEAERGIKAVNNIKNLLADYQRYRTGENEELNWREQ